MNAAVIVAGGEGERSGVRGGKQLALVADAPVLSHAIAAFDACPAVDAIVVVVHPERVEEYRDRAVQALRPRKVVAVVPGGSTRSESVTAGLEALPAGVSLVAVHDGARPLIRPGTIEAAFSALAAEPSADGVVVGHPAYDTLKLVDADGRIVRTVDRAVHWVAQTPQVFRLSALLEAYRRARTDGLAATDDSAVVEAAGGVVRMLEGPRDNIKVTVPEDLDVVDRVLRARAEESHE